MYRPLRRAAGDYHRAFAKTNGLIARRYAGEIERLRHHRGHGTTRPWRSTTQRDFDADRILFDPFNYNVIAGAGTLPERGDNDHLAAKIDRWERGTREERLVDPLPQLSPHQRVAHHG